MWIKEIQLKNFRNYKEEKIKLNKNINILYGENAQGKTNIIESIFLCSMGKSFRAKKDKEMIKINEDICSVEVEYEKSDREGKIKIEIGNKKNIFINEIKIKKLSELLGKINIVIFTPDDIEIIKGGPDQRRKFLDIMISQLRPNYIHILSLYQKTIEQRNNYLKQIKEENKDENLLEIWDEKLSEYAVKIYEYRKEFINKLIPKMENLHKERDDFVIYINGKQINIYGSQGQQRTSVLTLKLAELKLIYDEIGEYPILLLDDFMSELDKSRRESLVKHIKETQVIITCTDKLALENFEYLEYNVKEGKIIN